MDRLLNVQLDLQKSIIKGLSNFRKSPKERITKEYVQARLENLEKDWSSFRSNNAKLFEISDPDKLAISDYVKKEYYECTEEEYLVYKSLMKVALGKFSALEHNLSDKKGSDGPTQVVRLPKITIPTFSGAYSEWTTFRDLFVSLVDKNESLDNVQKLHYLKSHLSGEAEQLVRYTPISSANYSQCWSLLEKRYNNKKFLANSILKRLFSQKRVHNESASGLKELLDTTMDCLNALKNIDIDVSSWDVIIIHIVAFKLDPETRKQWELHNSDVESNNLPTLTQFKGFMENRFRALEFIDPIKPKLHHSSGPHVRPKVLLSTNGNGMSCEYCSEAHKLCFCKQFAKLSTEHRRDFVLKNRICFNCLGSNHTSYECQKLTTCRLCKKRHHSLLHSEAIRTPNAKKTAENASPTASDSPVVSCMSTRKVSKYGQVLLATALVNAESETCGKHIIRALIDQGSQACFITEATVQLLRLRKEPVRGTVTGLGDKGSTAFKHVVTIDLQSRADEKFRVQIRAYVLKNLIISQLPEQQLQLIDWIDMNNLCLADPHFNVPGKIDLLLGANIYSQILKEGVQKSPDGLLIAQKTSLGWIISGTVHNQNEKSTQTKNNPKISVMHAYVNEDDALKRFWEIEEQPYNSKVIWTEEEQKCEDIYKTTTKRTPEGRYVVKLPFREQEPRCVGNNSRQIAITRLKSLEKRLSKDLELKKSYIEVINEYLQLGHMRPVKKDDPKLNEAVYLPHHAVVRNDKTTTKVRVVFDASSKNSAGISLNDTLMVGPKLQADLRHLVLLWREHPIVLIADVVKMYRQVKIAEEDAVFQRVVWREDSETEIQDYELMTVTFGTACAPYLAVRSLNQVGIDEAKNYPLAAARIAHSFYMDDLMTGCNDVTEGITLYQEMKELLLKGGFQLQKWNSNNQHLLSKIYSIENKNTEHKTQKQNTAEIESKLNNLQLEKVQENNNKYEEKEIDIKAESITKILGITWDRNEDQFRYSVNLPTAAPGPETKRKILSVIARLYDPLGWLAPSIIKAKIIIQKLWLAGVTWDEPISEDLKKEWYTYRDLLHKLTSIRVPRWLGTVGKADTRELHGFCDASKLAYAAVVYLRVVDDKGNVHVSLLAAKTRVAPIKQISIPRLELCGATLLTRLLAELVEVLNLPRSNIKAWTDSTVVLAWLNSHPSRWKTFVANRVSKILTTLDSSQWFHVPTKENPADCASRGINPDILENNDLWFAGPKLLRQRYVPYDKPKDLKINMEEAIKSHVNTMTEDTLLQRFSSFQRMLRVVAYCRRFFKRSAKRTIYLSKMEIEEALICCIRKVQREEFTKEYFELHNKGYLENKSSKLRALCPYLDEKGMMRVRGRIQKTELPEDFKHPIILPHGAYFTKLLIADAHKNTLHGGIQLMINYLREAYWIIGVKRLVKRQVRRCVTCVRQNAKVQTQFMGSLPTVRCTPARAFLNSGVDYAGPIKIRTSKGRGNHSYKGYICLFICMATRAIHLEVVSDMSTQAFLAAYRRFVARRGHCMQLWSDNGTTFVGASKELNELSTIQKDIAAYLETHGTEWKFIPPHAPNFGGLWEAGIKSTKFHLKRVIGDSTLTFEEMATLLSQVEACLNSRPLTVDSSDPNDPRPLTPGHFLIGGPLLAVPDVSNYLQSTISSLTRWQVIQRMLQCFWRRWSNEYVSNLMNRYKWCYHQPEPEIGDVVLIKEDDLPPSRWLMGRIVEKHPGSDSITRVVSIRVKSSIVKRPTSKLCVLPVHDD